MTEMETIVLDGASLAGEDLSGKRLSYSGGQLPDLLNAKIDKTAWNFDGAAGNTLALLAILDILQPGFVARAVEQFKKQVPLTYGSRVQ